MNFITVLPSGYTELQEETSHIRIYIKLDGDVYAKLQYQI